jgi:class 3 adenylate cyclase/tetratricopeptide (TPR) repeat protein
MRDALIDPSPVDPLAPYVPRLVIDWLRTTPDARHRSVDGTLAFVDISGFTKLTERLARKGKVGAEEMSDLLHATFTALLGVAYADGAGLVKWGGDAVLLLFDGPEHAARACRAAHRMRETMREVGRLSTTAGPVTLRMSVGVHSGSFDFFLVGDPAEHRELIVSGPAATKTAAMEATANAGQVAVSTATAALLDPRVLGAPTEGGFLLRRAPDADSDGAPPAPDTTGLDLRRVIPPRIRDAIGAGAGSAEHRTATIAFVEFSGTDALVEAHGPDRLADALDECIQVVQHAVAAHDVTFFETDINRDGGKVMLTAGAPLATEHDEEHMLRAARQIVERAGVLPLRVGVNRGGVFANDFGPEFRRTYSVKGDAVNLAARVMGRAAHGQVVATLAVLERSDTVFDLSVLPPFTVKGKSQPVNAAVVGPVAGTRRDDAASVPLIGREAELAVLLEALAEAREGLGRAVAVVGEPGIGKSRLVNELRSRAPDATTIAVACNEYESTTPYATVRSLLREVLGVARSATPEVAHLALFEAVADAAPALIAWLPALGPVLDREIPDTVETARVDVRFRKTRLEEVANEVLAALLPAITLMLIDDAHLMDDASADLVARLVGNNIAERPWLVVMTRRDAPTGFVPRADSMTIVRPSPLDAANSLALLRASSEAVPLLPHAMELLARRAEGNPFFLRTLVQTAIELGGVDALPDSVEGLLNSQLDALPKDARDVLRHAAVLGTEFSSADLHAVLGDRGGESAVDPARTLAEFVEAGSGDRLRFRHALVRDAAYAGLPVRLRRTLHKRAGEQLESSVTAPQELAELLSLHYYEAGVMDRAWTYSVVAAERAEHKYAFVEAAEFLIRATDAARDTEVDDLALSHAFESLADAHLHVGGLARARTAYRSARQLISGDAVHTADLLRKEALVEQRLDRVPQALRTLTRALHVLDTEFALDATAERARLGCAYARCREKQGRYREAVRWGRQAEETARAAGDRRALAEAYEALHSATSMAGFEQPRPYGRLALELFEELGDREAQSRGLNNLGVLAWFEGHGNEALEMFERSRDAAAEAGDTLGAAASAHNVGDVLLRQGRLAEAEAVLRPLLTVFKGLGSEEYWASTLRWLGLTAVRSGRSDEGRDQIEQARAIFTELGLASEIAETDTAVAELLLATGHPAEAAELATDAGLRATALDAGYLLPTLYRLRGAALLAAGEFELGRDALEDAMRVCASEGAAETGFVLADLARATEVTDPEASNAFALRSAKALAELGHVADVA